MDEGEGFVVVSGLPGSGKSTLARPISQALGLPLLDKDAILERLFESKGQGDIEWRRSLSRESDLILQREAAALRGAVLVSHWHLPGMPRILELQRGGSVNSQTKLSTSIANAPPRYRPNVS